MQLKPQFFEWGGYDTCHVCGAQLLVRGFPARFGVTLHLPAAETARGEEEASCFHHESKKRSIRARAAANFYVRCAPPKWAGMCIAPSVWYPNPGRLGPASGAGAHPVRFDRAGAGDFSVDHSLGGGIGGAAAIYVAIRYWKTPGSLVRRYGWRRYLAILFGLGEIVMFVVLMVAVIFTGRR